MEHMVDSVNDYLYWSNLDDSKIMRSTLNGSMITIILDYNGYGSVGFLELDSEEGIGISDDYIFFSEPNQMKQFIKNSSNLETFWKFLDDYISDMTLYEKTGSTECTEYTEIKNEEKRSKDYITDFSSDQVINDDYLKEGWYRMISANGDKMPLSTPGTMHCRTIYPIWLNGNLPAEDDGIVSREACVQKENDIVNSSLT
ncbi:unnamed protein product [Mytilus coruscus]|uniref:Uncharacterized protein n=1 Tax=Mytilus coruscus TaxID=42192 RepID=A0A6J8DR96_MYTCO|nr:unnamed protein product [Mytilus coruscus]